MKRREQRWLQAYKLKALDLCCAYRMDIGYNLISPRGTALWHYEKKVEASRLHSHP